MKKVEIDLLERNGGHLVENTLERLGDGDLKEVRKDFVLDV